MMAEHVRARSCDLHLGHPHIQVSNSPCRFLWVFFPDCFVFSKCFFLFIFVTFIFLHLFCNSWLVVNVFLGCTPAECHLVSISLAKKEKYFVEIQKKTQNIVFVSIFFSLQFYQKTTTDQPSLAQHSIAQPICCLTLEPHPLHPHRLSSFGCV